MSRLIHIMYSPAQSTRTELVQRPLTAGLFIFFDFAESTARISQDSPKALPNISRNRTFDAVFTQLFKTNFIILQWRSRNPVESLAELYIKLFGRNTYSNG